MKEIPKGFKKMDLELTFENKLIKVWEEKILYFLIRDFYIFYTKIPKFPDSKTGKNKWTELHFYCRPQDEVSLAYRIGIISQLALKHYKDDYFKNPIHTVPKNFPDCIYIEEQK